MTFGEYEAAKKGFDKHEEALQAQRELTAYWQAQSIAGFTFGGKDFDFQDLFRRRPSNLANVIQEENPEKLAEECNTKGMIPPEKW